jgi:hypothetical protein
MNNKRKMKKKKKKKIWCIVTMDFYSVIKENEVRLFARKWMDLEIIMLNAISQTQKEIYYKFYLICSIYIKTKKKKKRHKSRSVSIWKRKETM